MKTKDIKQQTSFNYLPPRFASGYDRNLLIISDVSSEKKTSKVPNLMIFIPKRIRRNNQEETVQLGKNWK